MIDRAELDDRMASARMQGEPHFYIMELGPGGAAGEWLFVCVQAASTFKLGPGGAAGDCIYFKVISTSDLRVLLSACGNGEK